VKRCFLVLILIQIILLIMPRNTLGVVCFIDDSFNDLTKLDMISTTAEVDTTNGWVTLQLKNLANSLILYEDSCDITLISNHAVETYRFNGTGMELDFRRSINGGLIEPVSISGRSGEYLVLDRGRKEAYWYNYDGLGMVKNEALSISSLTEPQAVDIQTGTYDFALVDGKWVKWYGFDGIGMVPLSILSFNAGETSYTVSLSLEDDNFATVILDKANEEIRYYRYTGSTMEVDAAKCIQTPGALTNPRSISVSKDGGLYLVVDSNQVKAYNYDGSAMIYNPHLSVVGLNKPLAVSIKPGGYDYAVLSHDAINNPLVSYYAFNGNEMEEITELQVTGLDCVPFANDQVLQGKAVDAQNGVTGLKLLADIELPSGTSISWEVCVDGFNWESIAIGETVKFLLPGTHPNYRATLHTDNNMLTPKIFSVQLLDASLSIENFQVVDILGPYIPENPTLPTDQQVKIWAGYNVTIQLETKGCADSLVADIYIEDNQITLSSFNGELVPIYTAGNYQNVWSGTFYTDAQVPKGIYLDIGFTVRKGSDFVFGYYPEFAEIYGSALEHHQIHLTH